MGNLRELLNESKPSNIEIEIFLTMFATIEKYKGLFKNKFTCDFIQHKFNGFQNEVFNHNGNLDYWSIDFRFKNYTSIYTDCVVFYEKEKFDFEKVIDDIETIFNKARILF